MCDLYASKPSTVTTMKFRDGHVSTMETKNAHNGFIWKATGKRPFGTPRQERQPVNAQWLL